MNTRYMNGISFETPGLVSQENFPNYLIRDIAGKRIYKYKPNTDFRLIEGPHIFLFHPNQTGLLYLDAPFSELMLGGRIYYPKSFILKMLNSEYFTCFLENDNKTWTVLDEEGRNLGSLKRGMFKYETELCAIFYEDAN